MAFRLQPGLRGFEGAGFDFLLDVGEELVERFGAEVVEVAVADGDGAFFGFALADDEHVGDAVEAGVADFRAEFFGCAVDGDADSGVGELLGRLFGGFHGFVRDRQDADLFGCEPGGEFALEVFDEQSGEAFHGAEGGAMDHDRDVGLVVGADVGEVEADGQVVVDLDGAELPVAADDVLDDEVDFRAVECGFAEFFGVFDAEGLHGLAEGVFGLVPVFG